MDPSAGKRAEAPSWIEQLAQEAGKAVDRTVHQVEAGSRRLCEDVSREAKADARELGRRASIVMDEARNEMPRLRAELREMRARVRERIR